MLKSFWFWTLLLFILIQFVPKITPTIINNGENKNEIVAPTEVLNILKTSCYDCHSNAVDYPWYDYLAPASWYAQIHVKRARKALNFTEWNNYDKEKQKELLSKIKKATVIRMPLASYLWLHSDAKLSIKDKKLLQKWSLDLKEKIK